MGVLFETRHDMARKSWLSFFEPSRGFGIVVALVLSAVTTSPIAFAQIAPMRRPRIVRAPMMMPGMRFPGMAVGAAGGAGSADSAIPKIDPESQQLLKRADQFIADERYDLAAILWQKVLDEAGDNMVQVEGDRYVPLRSEVEAAISKAKPEAVAAYRLNADNEVVGMLARVTPENESEVLGQIVRRFFLSDQGDDAAYRIACRALDRGDFVLATRMFLKVLEEHPDPSISKGDLQLRMAVAAGKLGDKSAADEFLNLVAKAGSTGPARSLVGLVTRELAKKNAMGPAEQPQDFLVAWGGPARRGAMRGLPAETYQATLTDRGFFEYPLQFPEQINPQFGFYPGMPNTATNVTTVARPQLMDRWKTAGWRPAGNVLIQDGRIYLKTSEDLVCFKDAQSLSKPTWKTAWLNSFQVDDQSNHFMMFRGFNGGVTGRTDAPGTTAEILLFGDRIYHSMSIVDDLLLTLEGVRRGRGSEPAAMEPRQVNYNQSVPRRSRTNWLAAYDSKSGKVRWRRNADDEREEKPADPAPATEPAAEKPADGTRGSEPVPPPGAVPVPVPVARAGFGPEGAGSSCFMASPVACGGLLLVPVSDGGTIFLMAVSPSDGKTRWRTQLCDDPLSGATPWSPIGVAVDGQEAYVVAGTGLVFAVDGTTGDIRWASRYRRELSNSAPVFANPWQQNTTVRQFSGWDDDVAIPMGRQVVVMASDSDRMFALDRRTGKFLWDTPRISPFGVEANYYLGTQGNRLVAAGSKVVRGYDVHSGRLVWEREIEASCGRGCIAGDTVFVPSKDSIISYDLTTGKERSHVGVSLATNSGEYVGNLYSDGAQLWMLNANRLYALTSLASRLEGLKTRVEAGDKVALLERTRLLARSGDWDAALEDLRVLYQHAMSQQGIEPALTQVSTLMTDVEMPGKQPALSVKFVAEIARDQSSHAAFRNPDVANGMSAVMLTAMRNLDPAKDGEVAESLMVATSPYWSSIGMRSQMARTLGALSGETVPNWLDRLAEKQEVDSRRLAISIASQVENKGGSGLLKKLLADTEPRVRYEAARGLLHVSDRSALSELVNLLSSDDATLRSSAARSLRGVTRSVLPFDVSATGDKATEQLDAWKKWVQEESSTANLKLPYRHDPLMIGRTVVVNAHARQVIELDEYHKEIKRLDADSPSTVWAGPSGNKFVGMMGLNAVVEFDENWRAVWQSDPLPSSATSIHQGEDGVLVVACADARAVMRLDPNKQWKLLYQSPSQHRPVSVRRLEGGNTLIGMQGGKKVVEVNSDGKEINALKLEAGIDVMSAFRNDDGTTSVLAQGNQLMEFDSKGTLSRTLKLSSNRVVQSLQLLPSGNYLITDGLGAKELDPQGKIVWTFNETNANFAVRY
jgi:outer membrane protein assembly factor BamB